MPQNLANHHSPTVLVLVDVINHFEFPDGPRVLRNALNIVSNLARLKQRASKAGIPTVYVNDNFGQWKSDAGRLLKYCLRPAAPGREFVDALRPGSDDYFVLKPMHSAFYQTPLDLLLKYLGATSLVLAGLATNSCIVCTAHDAHMREFKLIVPPDCCAARTRQEHLQAIAHIKGIAGTAVMASKALQFQKLAKGT